MAKQIDPNKKYFYFCWGEENETINGKTVTDLEVAGKDLSVFFRFKVDGVQHTSFYDWAFWEDTPEGRAAFAKAMDLDKQRKEMVKQRAALTNQFTLSEIKL